MLSGLTCVVIFPAMLSHIIGGGYRGKEAFENLRDIGTITDNIAAYYKIFNKQIFGGFFPVFLILFAIILLICLLKRNQCRMPDFKMLLLFGTMAAYILIIAKISPYKVDRYVMPVGWLLSLWGYCTLERGLAYFIKNRIYVRVGGLILCLGMTLSAYKMSEWKLEYQFPEEKVYKEWALQYSDWPAVYIYDKAENDSESFKNDSILNHCIELAGYKEYSFVEEARAAGYISRYGNNPVILYIDSGNDNNKIINDILKMNMYQEVKLVYSYRGADIYCIS